MLNDEAHHCYRARPAQTEAGAKEKLTAEERKEAAARDDEARLGLTGLGAVHGKVGVKAVIGLSTPPSDREGSGDPEGKLYLRGGQRLRAHRRRRRRRSQESACPRSRQRGGRRGRPDWAARPAVDGAEGGVMCGHRGCGGGSRRRDRRRVTAGADGEELTSAVGRLRTVAGLTGVP